MENLSADELWNTDANMSVNNPGKKQIKKYYHLNPSKSCL